MKLLWREAREYEVHTQKLAERIITQMLFSEELFGEVPIFEEYYEGELISDCSRHIWRICPENM